ncbi:uncharacterized protein DSM5745_08080 [Aspergillus mulundensis]|uniref:Uncharacterized protein n=1 Tax=Aspergillus mulundensis TaxID=1810919 RepID=A0A3D8R936_9EURO|nr:hypothetical protein DSM5745_08080 [Aspergillus mulundensis]RDW70569.1 hypothetical protein DSM5745_08080 [Aspergillus mulundensis]
MPDPPSSPKSPSNQPSNPTQIASPPLAHPTPPQPAQILTFIIRPSARIEDARTSDGEPWTQALDIIREWPGFRALYWGRRVEIEDEEKVQVVVFRDKISQHHAFLPSGRWVSLQQLLEPLYPSSPTQKDRPQRMG